jgi:hypothetical protein
VLAEARNHMVFVQDHYSQADVNEFLVHALNSARCIDPSVALSKVYVMPLSLDGHGTCQAHFIFILAHQITDGLAYTRWMSSFIDLLNQDRQTLRDRAAELCVHPPTARLPPAQESLYPPVRGNATRQRWSWLLSRILRHVHKPPPASFQNPLRRKYPLDRAKSLAPQFSKVLDYTKTPPLNTFPIHATLSPKATRALADLCRQARISIGSGCFASSRR